MNIYEVIALVAAVVTIIAFMWSIKKDLAGKFEKLGNDITKLDTDMRLQSKRTDQQLASHSARIDKLYEMFVDLVSKMK